MPNVGRLPLMAPLEALPRTREYRETLHDSRRLYDVLKNVREMKSSGILEIHFSQGSPSGNIKWTERKD